MPIDTPCALYKQYIERWTRARDCREGSDAVKARGVAYLPMLDSHKTNIGAQLTQQGMTKYEEYKLRALYFNATGRTVDGLSGAIFQRTPAVELTPLLEETDLVEDVTLSGVTIELFALQATREVLAPGRYGILVDMADTPDPKNRPYWVGYRTEDIIAWRKQRINGDEQLVHVRLRETYELVDEKDPFTIKTHVQYRVLDLIDGAYTASIWRQPKGDSGEFTKTEVLSPVRRGEPLDFIPFVFIGPTTNDPDPEKPPLDDLVNVNLSHYRTYADLEHGRHFTALPTPWISGAAGGPSGEPLAIGSGKAWVLEKGGQAGMLEFSGAGLSSLVTADQDKRKMMATLGARMLEDGGGAAETAYAVGMRHSGEHASLRTVAQSIEQAITTALRYTGWWMGSEESYTELDDVKIEFNKDFFAMRMTSQELQALTGALQAEVISFSTFYAALQRGEIARPGVSEEEEVAEIKRSGEMFKKEPPQVMVGPDGQPIVAPEGGQPSADDPEGRDDTTQPPASRTGKPLSGRPQVPPARSGKPSPVPPARPGLPPKK